MTYSKSKQQQQIQIEMNQSQKKPKYRKAISRFKIKSKMPTDQLQYRQPQNTYFNTTKNNGFLTNVSVDKDENSNRRSNRTTQKDIYLNSNVNSFIQPNQYTTNINFKSQIKKQQRVKSTASNNLSKVQRTDRSRAATEGNLHLNYMDYEKYIEKVDIDPTYFQKIANRNDTKYQSIQQITQTIAKYMLNMQKDKKLPMKRQINKAKIETVVVKQPNMITGTQLGMNSLKQIRIKLEEKWTKEQKDKLENNTGYMSDQQSNEQIKKTTQLTMKKQGENKGINSSKLQKEKKEALIVWDKIANNKYKQSLRLIFEKKKGQKMLEETIFNENEYLTRQASLLKPTKLYKQKKFLLKHKIEWHP